MKRMLWFPLISAMLLYALTAHAGDIKVFVSPFDAKPEDEDLSRQVSVIAAGEVLRSKGFIYVSPSQYVSIVTRKKELAKAPPVDLAMEYDKAELDRLQEEAKPFAKSFTAFFATLEAFDMILGGKVERKGQEARVEITLAGPATYGAPTVVIECPENRLKDEVVKGVRSLLERASRPERVRADQLIDPELSKVVYLVKAIDGNVLTIQVDYTGDRPNPAIQSVSIIPPEGAGKTGKYVAKLKSEEGKTIEVTFTYTKNVLDRVMIDASIPDPRNRSEQAEVLTLKSSAGHILNVGFSWKNGKMMKAYIDPKLNAFSAEDYMIPYSAEPQTMK